MKNAGNRSARDVFCERCKERMANEFQNAYQKPEPKMENLRSTRDRNRMRYLKNE